MILEISVYMKKSNIKICKLGNLLLLAIWWEPNAITSVIGKGYGTHMNKILLGNILRLFYTSTTLSEMLCDLTFSLFSC